MAADDFRENFRRFPYILLLLLSLLVSACGSDSTTIPEDPKTLYLKAVLDASVVTPAKVYTGLTPITNDNPELIWENGVAGSRLLVTSWIGSAGASYKCPPAGCSSSDTCKEGRECPNYRWDSWVTVVPELKNYFIGTVPTAMRLAQLLGLPPEYATPGDPKEAQYFLEMWVSPSDLYRPCPDPEITDRECQTDYPGSVFWSFNPLEKVNATEGGVWEFRDYKGWFENRTQFIYSYSYPAANPADPLPYPWTRLGYTYDWGNPNPVGLSEYVLHGKKENNPDGTSRYISVGIKSVKTTAEYFTQ